MTEKMSYYCTAETTYLIRITDFSGTGGNFEILVECPPPANDHCDHATELLCGIPVQGTLTCATPTNHPNYIDPGNNDVFYYFTASCTGEYAITLTKHDIDNDIDLYVYSDCDAAIVFAELNGNDRNGIIEVIKFNGYSGITYIIRVNNGAWDIGGDFDILIECPIPENDHCDRAAELFCGTPVQGSFAGATPTVTIMYEDGDDRKDVFYQFTADITGTYSITLTKTILDDDINIYVYSDCDATTALVKLIDAEDGIEETKEFFCIAGTKYFFRAIDWNYSDGDFKILLKCPTPENDHCDHAAELFCGIPVQGSLAGATSAASAYNHESEKNDVFYYFTTNDAGDYKITLCNFSDDKDLFLYSDCSETSAIKSSTNSNTSIETITYNCAAGTTYIIRVTDFSGSGGDFEILLECPPPDFECMIDIEALSGGRLSPAFSQDVTSYRLLFECDPVNKASVRFTPVNASASIFVDGILLGTDRTKVFTKGEKPGSKIAAVTVEAGTCRREYLIEVVSPFEYVVIPVWDDVLSVINNPVNNGGYIFEEYQWYRDKLLTNKETDENGGRDPNIQVENNKNTEYTVWLVTNEGKKAHGCRWQPPAKNIVAVNVWPNPATDRVTVKIANRNGAFLMELHNMQGALLQKRLISKPLFEVNMSGLPSGIYLLSVDGITVRIVRE